MIVTIELRRNHLLNKETDIAGNYHEPDRIACALMVNGKLHSYLAPQTLELTPAEMTQHIRAIADEWLREVEAVVSEHKAIAAVIEQMPAAAFPTRAEVEGYQDRG